MTIRLATVLLASITCFPSTGVAAPVDIPGDRARRARDAHLANGIRIDREVWLRALAYAEGTLAHD